MFRELLDKYFIFKEAKRIADETFMKANVDSIQAASALHSVSTELGSQIRKLNSEDRFTSKGVIFEYNGKFFSFETNLAGVNVFVHELFSPEDADKSLMIDKLKGK